MVFGQMPKREHALIAEVLLKRAKHKLTRFPSVPRATDIDDGAQKLCEPEADGD